MFSTMVNTTFVEEVASEVCKLLEGVQCLKCTNLYANPEINVCGHSLCKVCWRGQKFCLYCESEVKLLKPNRPLALRTVHLKKLDVVFVKTFGREVKVAKPSIETPHLKNVEKWLVSSQNHFSMPSDSPDYIENNPKPTSSKPNDKEKTSTLERNKSNQEDWDKIEVMPENQIDQPTDIITHKEKENVIGPMDIETYTFETEAYTNQNPRRSSRNKGAVELPESFTKKLKKKSLVKNDQTDVVVERENDFYEHGSNIDMSNKRLNRDNVKRIRKEFKKLNKGEMKKLDVSIEMCKKTESIISKNSNRPGNIPVSNTSFLIEDITTPTSKKSQEKNVSKRSLSKKSLQGDTNVEVHAVKNVCSGNVSRYENNEIINLVSQDPEATNHEEINVCNNEDLPEVNVNISKQGESSSNILMPSEKANNQVDAFKSVTNSQRNENITENLENNNSPLDMVTIRRRQKPEECVNREVENRFKTPFLFKGKLVNKTLSNHRRVPFYHKSVSNASSINTKDDEIQITIKTGSIATSITVTNSGGCLKLSETKIERGIQTATNVYPSDVIYSNKDILSINNASLSQRNEPLENGIDLITTSINRENKLQQSLKESSKKNTDSAETSSAAYKITASVEKEMANDMKCAEEVDIFNSGVVPETNNENRQENDNMQLDRTNSEIITCLTMKSRKRDRNEKVKISRKKAKPSPNVNRDQQISNGVEKENENNSLLMNYDQIMGEVFANIDADIDECAQRKSQEKSKSQDIRRNKAHIEPAVKHKSDMEIYEKASSNNPVKLPVPVTKVPSPHIETLKNRSINPKFSGNDNKYSENLFSMFDKQTQNSTKDMEIEPVVETDVICGANTQENIENLLTPQMCENFEEPDKDFTEDGLDLEMRNCYTPKTPNVVHEDSDTSIVEETPQKPKFSAQTTMQSSIREKTIEMKNDTLRPSRGNKKCLVSQEIVNIINASGSTQATGKAKVPQEAKQQIAEPIAEIMKDLSEPNVIETPLTIKRFSEHITHKSTPLQPYARKSLNFTRKSSQFNEATESMCEGNITTPGRTSVDKILMESAFEKTPVPLLRQLSTKSTKKIEEKVLCVSCSCLLPLQVNKVKIWCRDNKWSYVDKFTLELTHLIVNVDENNAAQRSVKFMSALAAGKWIISFKWVLDCMKENKLLDEEPYEVLDSTGARGPYLSRTATTKLFTGITFFCYPPFSVLQQADLEQMLKAAGGKVVNEMTEIAYTKVKGVALLLAEMESTQEDKFMYLPIQHKIVPVNYEWALNCLGAYQLLTIKDLLLCLDTLIPELPWPSELMESPSDDESHTKSS